MLLDDFDEYGTSIPSTGLLLEPVAWMRDAAFAGMDTDLFFPERCPVRAECLEHALTAPEEHGTWGGTSEPERRQLRRER